MHDTHKPKDPKPAAKARSKTKAITSAPHSAWTVRPSSDNLKLSVHVDPASPRAGQPFWFSYRLKTPDGKAPDLTVTHENLSHFIVVRDDLQYFDHVHPQQVEPGKFMVQLTLPTGGHYVIYADATPAGEHTVVKQVDLLVIGDDMPAPSKLAPSDDLFTDGAYSVHFMPSPAKLEVGSASLTFHVMRDGEPATDLKPYLGAGGHLVVVSEDTQEFLHAHPEDAMGGDHENMEGMDHGSMEMGAGAPGEVSFHTEFPKPGLYKMWAQFLTSEGVLIAPFVADVASAGRG